MSKLDKSVKDAIRQHLPSQVTDELKIYFQEQEELQKELNQLKDQLDDYRKKIDVLKQEKLELKELVDRNGVLENKQRELVEAELKISEHRKKLEYKERNIQVEHLNTKLQAAERFANLMTDFMINMSKNTTYKRAFSGEIPIGSYESYYEPNGINRTKSPETKVVDHVTIIEEE